MLRDFFKIVLSQLSSGDQGGKFFACAYANNFKYIVMEMGKLNYYIPSSKKLPVASRQKRVWGKDLKHFEIMLGLAIVFCAQLKQMVIRGRQ